MSECDRKRWENFAHIAFVCTQGDLNYPLEYFERTRQKLDLRSLFCIILVSYYEAYNLDSGISIPNELNQLKTLREIYHVFPIDFSYILLDAFFAAVVLYSNA